MDNMHMRTILMMIMVLSAGSVYGYSFDTRDLPAAFTETFALDYNGSVSYLGFITGPKTTEGNLSINISIPKLDKGNYTSRIIYGNSSVELLFEITEDIDYDIADEDDFRITTDKTEYYVNDSVFITAYSPENISVFLNISNDNFSWTFVTYIEEASAIAFVPENSGNYSISALFNNSYRTIQKNLSFDVRQKLSCEIIGTDHIEENDTVEFTAEVAGNVGTTYYYWTYEDGKTDGMESSVHRFGETGDEKVLLRIQDSRNEEAFCEKQITIDEKRCDLKIIVMDSIRNKPLGDAGIVIGHEKEKTNVNGKAFFREIAAGTYKISISRDGYEQYSRNHDITDDAELMIKLNPRKPETEMYPVVDIANLEDNMTIKDAVQISFQVSSDVPVSVCRLLSNAAGRSGYRIVDDVKDPVTGKIIKLSGDLEAGINTIKVTCENKYGSGESRHYKIRYDDSSIEKDNQHDDHTTSSGKDEEDAEEREAEQEAMSDIPEEYYDLIESIKRSKKDFERMTREKGEIVSLMAYKNLLKNLESEVKSLVRQRKDLEKLRISKESYRSKAMEMDAALKKLSNQVPVEINILKKQNIIEEVDTDMIEEIITTYAAERDIDDVDAETLAERSAEIQDEISTLSKMMHAEVVMASGIKQTYTIISKEFRTDANLSAGFIVETVPKEVAESIRDITCKGNYEVIKEDPVFKPKISDNKLVYYVSGIRSMEDVQKVRSVFMLDPNRPENMITGFFMFNGKGGSYFSTFLIAIFVAGVLGTVTYSQRSYVFSIISRSKKQDIIYLLNLAMDHIRSGNDEDAIRLYPEILKSFSSTHDKRKEELIPMIQYISRIADAQYCNRLISKAVTELSEGRFRIGGDLQQEIEKVYEDMDDDVKDHIDETYTRYSRMLRLRLLRQDNKIQQIANRQESIEDKLYTTGRY